MLKWVNSLWIYTPPPPPVNFSNFPWGVYEFLQPIVWLVEMLDELINLKGILPLWKIFPKSFTGGVSILNAVACLISVASDVAFLLLKKWISDKTRQSGLDQCVPTTWHKHKTRKVAHDGSIFEYHLLANGAHQESAEHLLGLQAQFCDTRLCFVLSIIYLFFFSVIVCIGQRLCSRTQSQRSLFARVFKPIDNLGIFHNGSWSEASIQVPQLILRLRHLKK